MAAQPTSVTVAASFTLLPHRRDVWLAAWGEVARMAAGQLACRRACLLQDRSDSTRCVLLSEWDTVTSFNGFVRESGPLVAGRCSGLLPSSSCIHHFRDRGRKYRGRCHGSGSGAARIRRLGLWDSRPESGKAARSDPYAAERVGAGCLHHQRDHSYRQLDTSERHGTGTHLVGGRCAPHGRRRVLWLDHDPDRPRGRGPGRETGASWPRSARRLRGPSLEKLP
jgi:hypothetical protein